MLVPGSDILSIAMRVIATQAFQYYAFVSRVPNDVGQYISVFADPLTLRGSIQPIPRNLYMQYGLDFQRNYLVFYVQKDVFDVTRDISGDQMFFNGHTFQCISNTDWFPMDGWVSILTVQIPAMPVTGP